MLSVCRKFFFYQKQNGQKSQFCFRNIKKPCFPHLERVTHEPFTPADVVSIDLMMKVKI